MSVVFHDSSHIDTNLSLSTTTDPILVVVSILMAGLASYAAFVLSERSTSGQNRRQQIGWMISGAVALGGGVWAMHFIGMLAVHVPGMPVQYNMELTLLSMAPAVLASGLALILVQRPSPSLARRSFAALVLGSGIGAMHYTGMAAMEMNADIHYDKTIFILSIVAAVVLAFLSLEIKLWVRSRQAQTSMFHWSIISAAIVMGIAISAMHYTAMTGTYFFLSANHTIATGLDPKYMALAISAVTVGMLVLLSITGRIGQQLDNLLALEREINERHHAEEMLLDSENRFQAFLQNIPVRVHVKDTEGRFIMANPMSEAVIGKPFKDIQGRTSADLFPSEAARSYMADDQKVLKTGKTISIEEFLPARTPDDEDRTFLTVKFPIRDSHGKITSIGASGVDITERKKIETALLDSEQKFSKAFHHNPSLIAILDMETGAYYDVNDTWCTVMGYERKDVIGKTPEQVGTSTSPAERKVLFRKLMEVDSINNIEEQAQTKNGRVLDFLIAGVRLDISDKNHALLACVDITERKRAEQTIWFQANYDELTELPNRSVFFDRLQMARLNADRNNKMVAVHFMDLDFFKDVNDTEGHSAGDMLLIEVAKRLKNTVRKTDTVARLGGDEFGILQASIDGKDDSAALAQKILKSFEEPFDIGDKKVFIGGSLGITMYPDDDTGPEELLRNADIAMYAAKESGRNNYRYYTPDMSEAIRTRNQLETELREALEKDELFLNYQPKVDTQTGRIIGVEALLRWGHPEDGLISPGVFIPAAERSGLIIPLGEWVLRTACEQNKAWQDAGLPGMMIAVNLSAVQFNQEGLSEMVARTLEETGMDPAYLELEVTESTAMYDPERAVRVMNELHDLGASISLDDFGTGYSSFTYLKRFPLSRLKIDRAFIVNLPDNEDDATIVSAMIRLGHALKMKVTAEGIEREDQVPFLAENECDEIQGFYFHRPVDAEKIVELLNEQNNGTRQAAS